MIRSCNHSSFPKRADHPLNEPLNEAREAFTAGNLDAEAWATAVDEATTLAVAEQARAFIEIVTDGQLGWSGAHEVAADWLDGVETGETIDGLQPGTQEQQLVIRGAIQRNGSIAKRTYEVAKRVALTQVVKVALPGPVALARRADDQHYGDLDALCDAFAEVLEAEVKELAAAGAVAFQLDEPLLGQHPEDVDRVIRTAGRIFAAAGEGAMTTLSTYFGDLGAIVDRWAGIAVYRAA